MSQLPAPNGRVEADGGPRAKFLNVIKEAAVSFADAAPLSVPRAQQLQAIDRVVAAFRAAAARDEKFYLATPASIGRAIALCALTGLTPGGPLPQVDLIPRTRWIKDGEGWREGPVELNWQLAWRGYVALALRTGCRARPMAVFYGEPFEHDEGLDRRLVHRPDESVEGFGEWDALRCVYVVATYRDGTRDAEVLYRHGLEKRRAHSDAWQGYQDALQSGNKKRIERAAANPWNEWPIEMSLKTGIRYSGSRGLLQFDEPGQYAFAEDTQDDRSDPNGGTARFRVAPGSPAGLLPDADAEAETEQRPTHGIGAVAAAARQAADAAPAAKPADAAAQKPPTDSTAQTSTAPAAKPDTRKPPPPDPKADAEFLVAALKESPTRRLQADTTAKDGWKAKSGVHALRSERWSQLVEYGDLNGLFVFAGGYISLPQTPAPSSSPVGGAAAPQTEAGPSLVPEDLLASIREWEDAVGLDAALEIARDRDVPTSGDVPDASQLTPHEAERYRDALKARAEAK